MNLDDFSLHRYSRKQLYDLAYDLGSPLMNYLGLEIFRLLLDSKILIDESYGISKKVIEVQGIQDKFYELHSAALAFEGFLKKIIKNKKLSVDKNDSIGEVFGKKDNILRKKIKDKKLVARTKTAWEYCRNDIMHFYGYRDYNEDKEVYEMYDEIIKVIKRLYEDLYGKSESDDDMHVGWKKYVYNKMK